MMDQAILLQRKAIHYAGPLGKGMGFFQEKLRGDMVV